MKFINLSVFTVSALSLSALSTVESTDKGKSSSPSNGKSSSKGGKSTSPKCDRNSHQCCWVVRSWNLMKKETPSKILANDSSCCIQPMTGVTCDPKNSTILMMEWSEQGLSGSIPKDIGKLTGLQTL